ncbi:MAG TPA: ATP-grasp domain-containing protein [Citricoccus sp.]|nr:ATP-grasp domain-containing protein [uncultured Citricoccus sp.]HRO31312.1 ATP-grasp domain-containing protein [Citricoccus sp.]
MELVQAFQKAMQDQAPGSKVVAGDAQGLAPALYHADEAVLLPRVSDPTYLDSLCAVVTEHQISLVIPTIDPELPVLAEMRQEIESRTGTRVMIAEPWVTRICNDKMLTQDHVVRNGLLAPQVFERTEAVDVEDFPVILKPKAGSSSIGVHVVDNREQLDYLLPQTTDPMIQELVTGDEYTVDCFSDFEGNIVSIVPRLRIATRGGEILKGRIAKDPQIITAVKELLASLPMPGHSTVQCFKTERGIEFIEVNPRFGGGAPMSIAAGADSCANLIRLLRGEALEYTEDYEDGVTFMRFDQAIMIRDEQLVSR